MNKKFLLAVLLITNFSVNLFSAKKTKKTAEVEIFLTNDTTTTGDQVIFTCSSSFDALLKAATSILGQSTTPPTTAKATNKARTRKKNQRIHCDQCSETFGRKTELDRHKEFVHNPKAKKYSCNLCSNFVTVYPENLDRHLGQVRHLKKVAALAAAKESKKTTHFKKNGTRKSPRENFGKATDLVIVPGDGTVGSGGFIEVPRELKLK